MPAKTVYADNAGTTEMSKTALKAMMPFLEENFGNPSGAYSIGRTARRALEEARATVALAIGAEPNEIFFTGGGTEADNWAIRGIAEARASRGKHIISSSIEHHAVIRTCDYLKKLGYDITYLPVDTFGRISPDDLKSALRNDTILVSIMAANNEIGTIQPIKELAAITRERGVLFHSDAVQAVGHVPVSVKDIGVDMMSIAAHKFRGPKGVGALYIRKGVSPSALIYGGGQEKKHRGGTENVAGVVGMAAALEEAVRDMGRNMTKVSKMRDRLISELLKIPYTRLTGDPVNRLPGTASFVFDCIEGESLVLLLDREGICASSGSACSTGSLDPSHVLTAIGLPPDVVHGSLRLSINECTTDEDIEYILEKVPPVVEKLRAMSPLWEDRLNGKY